MADEKPNPSPQTDASQGAPANAAPSGAPAPATAPTPAAPPAESTYDARAQFIFIEPVSPTTKKLKDFMGSNPDVLVTDAGSAAEAMQVGMMLKPCVLVGSIQNNGDTAKLLVMVQNLKNDLKKGNVKAIIISKLKDSKIIGQFEKFGVHEFIVEPIPDRQLQFKGGLQIKANKAARKKQKDVEMKKISAGDKKTADADLNIKANETGPKGPGVKDAPANEVEGDVWCFKGGKPAKKGSKWAFRTEGPDPTEGEWQKMPDTPTGESQWRFMPKNPEEAKKGTWQYEGDEPTHDGQNGWGFRGAKPKLVLVDADGKEVATKVSTDEEGNVVAAQDSNIALQKDAARQELRKAAEVKLAEEKLAAAQLKEVEKAAKKDAAAQTRQATVEEAKKKELKSKSADSEEEASAEKTDDHKTGAPAESTPLKKKASSTDGDDDKDEDDQDDLSGAAMKEDAPPAMGDKRGEDEAPASFNDKTTEAKVEATKKKNVKIIEDDEENGEPEDETAENLSSKNFLKKRSEEEESTAEATPEQKAAAKKAAAIQQAMDQVTKDLNRSPEQKIALLDMMKKKLEEEAEKAGPLARGLTQKLQGLNDDADDDDDTEGAEGLRDKNFLKKKGAGAGKGDEEGGEDGDGVTEDAEEGVAQKKPMIARDGKTPKKKRDGDEDEGRAADDDADDDDLGELQSMAMEDEERETKDYDPSADEEGASHSQITDDVASKRAINAKQGHVEDEAEGEDHLNIDRQNSNTYKAGAGGPEPKQYPLDHFGSPDGTWESCGVDSRSGSDGKKIYVFVWPEVKMKRIPDCTRLPVYWISRERPGRSTKLQAWLFKESEPERFTSFDALPLDAQKLLLSYSANELKEKQAEVDAQKKEREEELDAEAREAYAKNDEDKNKDHTDEQADDDESSAYDKGVSERKDRQEKELDEELTEQKQRHEEISAQIEKASKDHKDKDGVDSKGVDNDDADSTDFDQSSADVAAKPKRNTARAEDKDEELERKAEDQKAEDLEDEDLESEGHESVDLGPVRDRIRQRELSFILGMSELVMNPEVSIAEGIQSYCEMLADAFAKASVTVFMQTGVGKVTVIATHAGSTGAGGWTPWSEHETKDLPLIDSAAQDAAVKTEVGQGMAKTFCSMVTQSQGIPLAYILINSSRLSEDQIDTDIAYLRAVTPAIRGFLLSAARNLEALKAAPSKANLSPIIGTEGGTPGGQVAA